MKDQGPPLSLSIDITRSIRPVKMVGILRRCVRPLPRFLSTKSVLSGLQTISPDSQYMPPNLACHGRLHFITQALNAQETVEGNVCVDSRPEPRAKSALAPMPGSASTMRQLCRKCTFVHTYLNSRHGEGCRF